MELKSAFKFGLIFLISAVPTTMALAQPSNCPMCSFNGFTIGAGVGATTFMNKSDSDTLTDSALPIFVPPPVLALPATSGNAFELSASNKVYDYGPMGALFVGYGYVFDEYNHTYLGAELGLNFLGANNTTMSASAANNASIQINDTTTDPNISGVATYNDNLATKTKVTRNSVEPFLDVKLGFLMTPTALVYLRGGINYNTIKVKTTGNYDALGTSSFTTTPIPFASPTASTSTGFSSSKSNSQVGYRAGIGMEVMVTPALGVGADYVYSFYRNTNTSTTTSSPSGDVSCDIVQGCQVVAADITNTTKVSNISDQQVMAQLIYHLG